MRKNKDDIIKLAPELVKLIIKTISFSKGGDYLAAATESGHILV